MLRFEQVTVLLIIPTKMALVSTWDTENAFSHFHIVVGVGQQVYS